MGGKTSTTTQVSTPPAFVADAYKDLVSRGQSAANAPYTAYTGQRVAPFQPDQLLAFGQIKDLGTSAAPYWSYAKSAADQSMQGITDRLPGLTQQYMDPYLDSVINSTLANIGRSDAVAQNDLLGKAIQSGASPFGGDRAGVTSAELARNQALARNQTIAGLQSQGYQNAQQAAMGALSADQAAARAASELYSGLGQSLFQTDLGKAGAMLQSGNAQQQQMQNIYNTNYQTWEEKQNYAKNQAAFLGQLLGLSSGSMGGTSSTTQPNGNVGSTIAGLATTLLGLFLKDGGAVPGYAEGGAIPHYDIGGAALGGLPYLGGPMQDYYPGPGFGAAQPPKLSGLPTLPGIDSRLWDFDIPDVDDVDDATPGQGIGAMAPAGLAGGFRDDPRVRSAPRQNAAQQAPTGLNGPPPPPHAQAQDQGGSFGERLLAGLRGARGGKGVSPLVYAGLGMMASRSPHFLQGVGEGALAGLQAYDARRAQDSQLDEKPIISDEGATVQLYYPSTGQVVDTGLPGKGSRGGEAFDPSTVKEVDGNLVQVGPDGANVIYQNPNGPKQRTGLAGNRLINMDTGDVIAEYPTEQEAKTALERQLEAAGLTPGTPEFQDAILEAVTKPGVEIAGEKKYDQDIGAAEAQRYNDILAQADSARDQLNNMDLAEKYVNDPNFYSGPGSGLVQQFKRAIAAVAGDETAAAMEGFNAVASQAALANMGGSLGAGFSNADRDFVVGQVMNLANSPEGNRVLIEVNRRVARRKLEIERMALDYEEKHGRLDSGFRREIAAYAEANPIFADLDLSNIPKTPGPTVRDDIRPGEPTDAEIEEELRRRGVQ